MFWWEKPLIAITVSLGIGLANLQASDLIPAKAIPLSPTMAAPAPPGWQLLSPAGGRFSILMPIGKIERDLTRDPKTPSFVVKRNRTVFLVAYFDIPPEALGRESELLNAATKTQYEGFKLVSRRDFGLNGNPGIEINYSSVYSAEIKLVTRCILANDMIYILTVIAESPERSNMFFDSFRLL